MYIKTEDAPKLLAQIPLCAECKNMRLMRVRVATQEVFDGLYKEGVRCNADGCEAPARWLLAVLLDCYDASDLLARQEAVCST